VDPLAHIHPLDEALLPGHLVIIGSARMDCAVALTRTTAEVMCGADSHVAIFTFGGEWEAPLSSDVHVVREMPEIDAEGCARIEAVRDELWLSGDDDAVAEAEAHLTAASYCSWVRRKVERIARATTVCLVVIDDVQGVCEGGTLTWDETLAQLPYELKRLARKLDVPVLLTSRINRSSLRAEALEGGDGALENAADAVFLMRLKGAGQEREPAFELIEVQPFARGRLALVVDELAFQVTTGRGR
jgi:DnaB-like helicase C terminal domain